MEQVLTEQTDTTGKPQKKLNPSSLPKCRKAMTSCLNEFRQDPSADVARFRAQISALRAIAECHRYDFEDRLQAIEDVVRTDGGYIRRVH